MSRPTEATTKPRTWSRRAARWALASIALSASMPLVMSGCGDDESGGTGSKPPTPAERMCNLIKEAIEGCDAATPCDQALVDDCASVAAILSDPMLEAAADCIEAGGSPGSCLASATGSLSATDAHRGFATKFCADCLLGVPGCEDAFFSGTGDTQLAGLLILPFGDEVANQITAECTSDLTCAATLVNCAQGVIAQQAIPEATIQCTLNQLTGGLIGDGGTGGAGSGGGSGMSDTGGDCTVEDPDGTSTGSGTDTGTGTGTGTGPSGQCGTYYTSTGDPTCQACFESACCAQLQSCSDGTTCDLLLDCSNACAENDVACYDACIAANPDGVAPLDALTTCTTVNCKNMCPFGPACGTGISIDVGGPCDQCIEASCCTQLDGCLAEGVNTCLDCLSSFTGSICSAAGTAARDCILACPDCTN